MASKCNRIINRASISSFKSAIKTPSASTGRAATSSPSPSFALPTKPSASPFRRFSTSRCPSELGGVQSLLPLHNAVSAARMTSCLSTTSRSCRALSQGTLCRTSPSL